MNIDLSSLKYSFKNKPLLVGGKAMEYYGLRKAGADIDFIVSLEDYENLAKMYPDNTEDIFGDKGVKVDIFEIWTCIRLFDYNFYSQKAIEEDQFLVISLDKLFLLKGLAALDKKLDQETHEKYMRDLEMIAEKIENIQYDVDKTVPKLR